MGKIQRHRGFAVGPFQLPGVRMEVAESGHGSRGILLVQPADPGGKEVFDGSFGKIRVGGTENFRHDAVQDDGVVEDRFRKGGLRS